MLNGRVVRNVAVEMTDDGPIIVDDQPVDLFGHGTACGAIVLSLAPEAELVSIRVLGADLRGKGAAFAAGLEWAIDRGPARLQHEPLVEERGALPAPSTISSTAPTSAPSRW